MNVIQEIEKLFEQVKDAIEAKYGTVVRGNMSTIVDEVKGQATDLLKQAGHDVAQDAAEVESDVHDATAPAGDTPAATVPAQSTDTPAQ
jgi:gas vesicle protein